VEEVDEQELHVERVTALDLGKAALEACVRVPHESRLGRRLQEVRGYATTTAALLGLADWLHSWGVTRVVMESTSAYWKGVFWLLEAEGFDCWLVNARDVKNVPGAAQDRQGRCGLAGQDRRAGHVPALAGAPPPDSPAARSDPLPSIVDPGPNPRDAAGGAGCWKTPRSSSARSPATSSGSRGGRCWRRWWPASVTQGAGAARPPSAAG
jgi:hypothetical protein